MEKLEYSKSKLENSKNKLEYYQRKSGILAVFLKKTILSLMRLRFYGHNSNYLDL